jgi:hypothetical protein
MRDKVGWTIWILLWAGSGIGILIGGIVSVVNGKATMKWPVTQGAVVSVKVGERVSTNDHKDITYYFPVITYKFTVGGRDYTADRLSFSSNDSTFRTETEAFIKTFPIGKKVSVHYNPASPRDAILEPGSSAEAWAMIVLAVPLIALGIGIPRIFANFRKRTPEVVTAEPV